MEIVIKNADNEVLEMLEKLKATKQDLEIECCEDSKEYRLSEEDEAHLQETLRLYREGKSKSYTLEEAKAMTSQTLKKLGANV